MTISKRASDLGKRLSALVDVLRPLSSWGVQNVYRITMFGFQVHHLAVVRPTTESGSSWSRYVFSWRMMVPRGVCFSDLVGG